ncbi:hypothetical protein [Streptomyces sp. DH10]|nr:hypothetical protein [Streptomyces sp. DH10]MDG9709399.1 hypothetical protein [Streptomyces sp. DH10]
MSVLAEVAQTLDLRELVEVVASEDLVEPLGIGLDPADRLACFEK